MIPLREFAQLENEIRKAFEKGDYEIVARVNRRLREINVEAFLDGDTVFLVVIKRKDQLIPEDGES